MARTAWVVTVALVSIVISVLALANASPRTHCTEETPSDPSEHWLPVTQIQVEPWRGPHHVYGLFTIPKQYKFHHLYAAKLTIEGMETEFTAGSPEDSDPDSVTTTPGYYTKRVYVSTRTALWFLATGRFGDLRMPCHWWLVLTDTGWRPTGNAQ